MKDQSVFSSSKSPARRRPTAFTLVEVMMAATILVIGFVGMVEAIGFSSNMIVHSRRQSYASGIISHEIEKLRFSNWTTISGLSPSSTAIAIDRQFWPTWSSATGYVVNNVVTYNGAWYRCTAANLNALPTNTAYWTAATSAATTDIVSVSGATYTLARTLTNPDPITNIREVNFTVTWVVTTSRRKADNSALTFTYTLGNSAWVGKYGLNYTYQRS